MSRDDRELEALLRRALADEAGGIEPAGDGLRRIRARTARPGWRSRWSRWSAPALALAGAAAVIAAVMVLPRMLPAETTAPPAASGPPPAATSSSSPAPTPAGPPDLVAGAVSLAATPPSPAPAPSGSQIPGAGVADLATVWPYASRAEGYARAERDVADGTVPDLTRPDRAATAFVRSFLGSAEELTAVSAGAWQAGLRMEVRLGDAPVSLVYLVRVRVGDDAPYVVVDAMAPGSLTLDTPVPPAVSDASLVARGTKHSAGRLDVQLRVPGTDEPTAATGATLAAGDWSARLGRQPGNRVDVVAAWTTDQDGDVTGFAATPVVAG
ncbi:MAG TPA: hypothetical protein VE547_16715 [Mycobacteriales bacterium]|nr:hypothetical protein [Mycobacteriales bacterium]